MPMEPFISSLVIYFLSLNPGSAVSVQVEPPRFRTGDESLSVISELDDADWTFLHPVRTRSTHRQWWARLDVSVVGKAEDHKDLVFYIYTLASYDIYWNSQYLGRNGKPAKDKTREIPGQNLKMIVVPAHLLHSESNRLMLRMSSWHSFPKSAHFRITAGPLQEVVTKRKLATVFYAVLWALICLVGFWFLAYRHPREPSFSRFGWLCMAVASLQVLEQGKHLITYPYPWHIVRLSAISCLTLAVAVLLPRFLVARFQLSERPFLFLAYFFPLLFPFIWFDSDVHCYWMFLYTLGFCIYLCIRAYQRQRNGRHAITFIITICFVLATQTGERFADTWFFPAFLAMVALLALQLIWETKAWRKALFEEKLTSSRLEIGLLRKSIQPHFLKNTLAAALAWFEENPTKGSALLRSLAEELDFFFNIGDRNRIAIEEELALCHKHLETMGYLLEQPLVLHYQGPPTTIAIPPGLLITSIENAVTHGCFSQVNSAIHLTVTLQGSRLQIQMRNPAKRGSVDRTGTGTRYLKALLAHHFPVAWHLSQDWRAGFWQLTITIEPFSNQTITQEPVTATTNRGRATRT